MPWGVVVLTTVIGSSLEKKKLARIFTNFNRQWLPVEYQWIFKTPTVVYKFLHSGYLNYFGPLLSICSGKYGKRYG